MLLLVPLAVFGQELTERQPLRLSLKQAVEIALAPEGNARIQLAEEAMRQSRARSAQARAALLPNVDGQASYQSQTRNLAAMGIRFNLPFPGVAVPTFVGPFSTFDARLSATQSVFDFSSIRRFQASRAGIEGAKAEAANVREQIAAQVARLYYTALAAQAHWEAVKADVELSETIERLAVNRRNAGVGTGIEVTRAQVQLANDRQRLVVADNQRRQARLELLRGMSMSLDTEVELTDSLSYVPVEETDLKEAAERALAERADLKAQETRERAARLNYSAVKFERLPSVAGFADYGSIGTGLGSSLPTRTYGVAVRVPLFDGGRRDARRQESLSELRQEAIRTADLKDQIELEIRLALDSLRSAEEQLKVAREGLELAEREAAQARRRYEAGVAGTLEPADAQARLARARDNQIAALLAYNLARISLAQAMGSVDRAIQ
ncbi:MAG TPA: TolC family protein [Bryobacteraceae bacterium]|nr:TolC family protein [Bryobacteraceae bacterium]HPU72634.1 TolC family protein [Bryobacteraceae bacterium]